MPGEVTAVAVMLGLRNVLGAGSYRQRAEVIADQMQGMTSPQEVVEILASR